jgi:predicted heme/steroid binding protein
VIAQAQTSVQKTYTATELSQYIGIDPSKPILLALDGLVYDVTAGREFYQPGGSYHDLAGKDSSTELHLVGGDIIKRKYPVVGTFAK